MALVQANADGFGESVESPVAREWSRIADRDASRALASGLNRDQGSAPQERKTMAEIMDVTDDNFESEVLKSNQPVIVDFWAEWCAPCRQIAPIIKELAGSYDGKVKVVKVDVDSSPKTAGQFGIRSIPSVLAFQDGQVVEQLMGARPKSAFVEMADKLL
jgi:thioredoxin 1